MDLQESPPRTSPRKRTYPYYLDFRNQNHSLRLSASNIAAMAGFHPWKNLAELVMQLVYQGHFGQELLRHDCELLGVHLHSKEQVLLEIAAKAGAETTNALQAALKVSKGTAHVDTVQEAERLKSRVMKTAQDKALQPIELKTLVEGVRNAVDTGYGTFHENEALNCYEQQTGWPVRERNAAIRSWPFGKLGGTTAVPLQKARDERSLHSGGDEEMNKVVPATFDVRSDAETNKVMPATVDAHPYFTIVGSVDGIRDELAPCRKTDSVATDDEFGNWDLRCVVVECKHRMSRFHPVPPLYEQIQTAVYCMMFDAQHADIVQVMRQAEGIPGQTDDVKNTSQVDGAQETLDNWFNPVIAINENAVDATVNSHIEEQSRDVEIIAGDSTVSKENYPEPLLTAVTNPVFDRAEKVQEIANVVAVSDAVKHEASVVADIAMRAPRKKKKTSPILSISRVSLDDDSMQHRKQWSLVVLPRLRSFVDAIYTIRSDDHKRYRLLMAASDPSGPLEDAWQLLFEECPWLADSDTAFRAQFQK
jgi:hypothetical protein